MKTEEEEASASQEWFHHLWQTGYRGGRYLYPRTNPTTQWELFEREKAACIDRLLDARDLSEGLVLECGCGTAGISVYLANNGFRCVATDVSARALELARSNAERNATPAALAQFYLAVADVRFLPFPDDVFELVMSHGMLEHFDLPLLRPILKEMVRVLKPGGLFLADIAHGAFSVRKLLSPLEAPISCAYYLCRRDMAKIEVLRRRCALGFYENSLDHAEWQRELEFAHLSEVHVLVLRPFPPLALTPPLERAYVSAMERLLGIWRWFDQSQSYLTRRWGWLYLAHGTKPG